MYCKRLSWIFELLTPHFFFFSILILILIFSLLSLQAFDLKRISDIYFVFSFFLSFDFRILFILFYLN